MKRLFDILFSLAGLIVLFLLFIVVGILIKFDSRGKIFFTQRRVGKDSKEFSLFKFRTMREGSEKSGMLTVGERDSRITRIGFYLRKYKLDELPQLINVLAGDMSMVGPRPEVRKFVDMYSEEQRKVLSVKPGITDIASIRFAEESAMLAKYTDAEEAYVKEIMPAKLALSLEYIKNRSFTADIAVIAKTAPTIFSPLTSHRNFETLLLSLLVFSFPFYEKVSAALAVAVAVFRVFDRRVITDMKQALQNILAVLFLTFYAAHLAGTLYSSNLSYAFFDLQVKLPFLFFPLLLTVPFSRWQIYGSLKNFFIAGCTIASLWCLAAAIVSYSRSHYLFDFYYTVYSRFIHVTYFSIYLNLCILFLIDDLINTGITRSRKILKITLLIFLFITVLLLAARTAMLTCFITGLAYSITVSIHRKMLRRTYKAIVLVIITFTAAGIYSNLVYNRFEQVTEILLDTNKNKAVEKPKPESYTSASIRLELWKDSWEVIKQNMWFGVGTGDIKDVLEKIYTEKNFFYGAEKRFNPHNQFLHTWVMLGLAGLLILVLLLAIPFFRAWNNKNYLFAFLCIMIAFNCMTESVLEVQKGVLFFSVFGLLLFNSGKTTD